MTERDVSESRHWTRFGRLLVLLMAGFGFLLGVGSTVLSVARSTRELRTALESEGREVVRAAARAAYVPLALEDEKALRGIVQAYAMNPRIRSVEIRGRRSGIHAQFRRPAPEGEAGVPVESEVHPPGIASAPSEGVVRVTMATEGLTRHRRRVLRFNLAVNTVLTLVLLGIAIAMVRRMTGRMHELVAQAVWAAELRRSNKELQDFAYVASHDLQSPLRKVSGFSQLLREEAGPSLTPTARGHLDGIERGVTRMRSLIQDLLSYSRAGSEDLRLAKVDSAKIVREVVSDLEPQLAEARGKIELGDLPPVTADPHLLYRVFLNLLSNAIKFRAKRPLKVTVSAQGVNGDWEFRVRDNGIGIDPRYASKVFQMFKRLHGAGRFQGNGIGLALVRKIVERHGGSVRLESEDGKGAAFVFRLPREPD